MIIKVDISDILFGIPEDGCCCPIARALGCMGFTNVTVCEEEINTDQGEFIPTRSAQRFIRKFDRRLQVAPFNFRLVPRQA